MLRHPQDNQIATSFRALSHPRRAAIFRTLCQNPECGRSFITLQAILRLPSTSLIHHLREMERCGLIKRYRKGAEVKYLLTTTPLAAALGHAAHSINRHRTQVDLAA